MCKRLWRWLGRKRVSGNHVVALLPWLRLESKQAISIGPVKFVSLENNCTQMKAIAGQGCEDLNKIISSYKDIEGNTVNTVTILLYDGQWRMIRGRDEAVIDEVTRIATLASMARNEFFQESNGRYANATLFEPIFQACREGNPHLAFRARRRDGYVLSGDYEHGKVNIACPIECQGIQNVEIDRALADALWNARETPIGRRIITALSFFCLANTDSPTMELDAEVILMASAFDQVFETEKNNAHELAIKLGSLLNNYGSVSVEKAMKTRKIWLGTHGVAPDEQRAWKVHQKWIEEFYHLRNEKVHGDKRRQDDEWGWSMDEHLVMASFIFPLVVKLLLAQETCYSLTHIDKRELDNVDMRLTARDWSQNWNKTDHVLSDRAKREIIDEVNAAVK